MSPDVEIKRLRELCAALTQIIGCIVVDIEEKNYEASCSLDKINEILFKAATGKCPANTVNKLLPWTFVVNNKIEENSSKSCQYVKSVYIGD